MRPSASLTRLGVIETERLTTSRCLGVKERLLRQRRYTSTVSGLVALIVPASNMLCDAVVPQRWSQISAIPFEQRGIIVLTRSTCRPFEPTLNVNVALIHIIKVVENDI